MVHCRKTAAYDLGDGQNLVRAIEALTWIHIVSKGQMI